MRFLALQPPRMLSFTWNAPPSLPEARQQRTFVVVRIHPVSERETRVTLHHTGWATAASGTRPTPTSIARGQRARNLKKRFETGPVDWTAWLEQMRKITPKN